jgi:hypothetical protein
MKLQVKNLGKIALGALVYMHYPLHAEMERGTLLVVYFSQDKIVLAADSLTLIKGGGTEKREYSCKIAALGKNTLFAAAGRTGYRKEGPADPVPDWTAIGEAQRIYTQHPTEPPEILSDYWEQALIANLIAQLKSSSTGRQIVEDDAARHERILTSGLFLYAPPHGDFQSKLSRVTYPRRNFFEAKYGDIPTSYLALGEPNAVRIVLEYVSLQSDRAKEEAEEWNQQQQSLKGDKEALRAKRLVELAIKHDQSGEIGGEIDVAILRKNGTVEWAANPNCK